MAKKGNKQSRLNTAVAEALKSAATGANQLALLGSGAPGVTQTGGVGGPVPPASNTLGKQGPLGLGTLGVSVISLIVFAVMLWMVKTGFWWALGWAILSFIVIGIFA